MAEAQIAGGIGQSIPRKEDARFIRGKGNYVDDVDLPGMLFLDLVRSPYAHAKITAIRKDKALQVPGVLAVITGADLAAAKLAWMPTLMSDTQMVLPTDTVMFQGQEVAGVVAVDRYAASDGVAAVEVDYEPLPVVVDPFKALEPGAPILRPDKGKKDNHIWHWEVGDKAATEQALKASAVVIKEKLYIPRIHVSSIETCGCVAQVDAMGKLTVWMTTQAPHAIRTVFALVSGLPEQNIRVISPDIGGGFGGKVPVYPGYVIAVVAALTTGKPVKWIEDRTGNLTADSFARDYHIEAEMGATKDGKLTALRVKTLADHGYTDAAANPSKFPAGLFHIITGSYPFQAAFVEVDAAYTNKPPGGIAYRCSFRVTEAAFAIERLVENMAHALKMDPAEFRMKNFIPPEAFPFKSVLGWTYDSGNYGGALKKAMQMIGYDALRKEQAEKRKRGELMGIGISSFTEIVGAGPSQTFDILGIKMFDSAEVRIHPTGKVLARLGTKSQGQGHETTYAQILAEELGLPSDAINIEEGDTDTAPYGLGTYASRSTPTSGAAAAVAARRIREKATKIAAHLLEVAPADIEWKDYKFQVKGVPGKSKTMADVAFAAYTNLPPGLEPGLEATDYYDPPNMTYPFGSYICAVDVDKETGQVKVRRFVAVDDCGTIINPTIVDGQISGGLTMGFAPAMLEEIPYDADGNNRAGNFLEYLLPTAVETPKWEMDKTVTPSPHHPFGAKGVGESATVGAPAAIVNAVLDALAPYDVTNIDIPLSAHKIWKAIHAKDPH
ncbi:MAG TPA: aerobic carbon-monoxide dehydrogenase large subunit [Thermoplasmata archaeon]|nr:aerobic carbon-monoxide dehydrogenase large subunit [Thermoplasmata archaeon]